MAAAIRRNVTVQPGGVVEVRSPDLKPGARAEVIMLVEDQAESPRSLVSFIGSGRGLFKSVEEIDGYTRQLRDEWDR